MFAKVKSKKGFTLVELIVVLVILAILAALLVPALTGYIDKANKEKVVSETRMLHTAIQTEMSALYAKPEWKNYTPSVYSTPSELRKDVLAAKTSTDTSATQRYNDIVALSELTSLSSDTGVFGAYVTETGKVASLVYYDGKGYVGVYLAQTQEYLAYTKEEAPSYSSYANGFINLTTEYTTDTTGTYYSFPISKDAILGTILKSHTPSN